MFSSQLVTAEEMQQVLLDSKNESLRYGVALDAAYGTALLEAELKGYKEYKQKVKYRLIPGIW